jgi:hypothetical protein
MAAMAHKDLVVYRVSRDSTAIPAREKVVKKAEKKAPKQGKKRGRPTKNTPKPPKELTVIEYSKIRAGSSYRVLFTVLLFAVCRACARRGILLYGRKPLARHTPGFRLIFAPGFLRCFRISSLEISTCHRLPGPVRPEYHFFPIS